MAIYQTAMKTYMAAQYAAKLTYIGALTALGTSNAVGTEVTGGSPAYARGAAGWGTASAGAVTSAAVPLNIPASTTVVAVGLYDASSGAPTDYDQASVTSQAFASQGTYTVTATFTET
jgi:hypothetical protein